MSQASRSLPSSGTSPDQQQQATSSMSSWMSATQFSQSYSSVGGHTVRSSPIAIVRNDKRDYDSDDNSSSSSSSSQESSTFDTLDCKDNDQSLVVGSLPTRSPTTNPWTKRSSRRHTGYKNGMSMSLPAAPMLKARGGSNSRLQELDITPMSLTEAHQPEHDDNQHAYGSLRDSHLEGRFLDGPCSYRDKGTGHIRSYRRSTHIRFDDSSTSNHPNPPLSVPTSLTMIRSSRHHEKDTTDTGPSMGSWSRQTPGERMQLTRQEQQQEEKLQEDTAATLRSSLSSLMLVADAVDTSTSTTSTPVPHMYEESYQHHPSFDRRDEEEEAKLSTSLTALEVLQRTQPRAIPAAAPCAGPIVEDEGLPVLWQPAGGMESSLHAYGMSFSIYEGDPQGVQQGLETRHPDSVECFDLDLE